MLPRVGEGEGGRDCVCHMWEVFGVATGKLHTHTHRLTHPTVRAVASWSENSILITVTITNVICATQWSTDEGSARLHCCTALPHWWISRCCHNRLKMQQSLSPLSAPLCPSFTCSAGRTGLPGSAWTVVKAILCCISNVLQSIYLFALCLCFVFFLLCFLHSLWLKVHWEKWRLSWNWTLCMCTSLLSVSVSEIFFLFLFSTNHSPFSVSALQCRCFIWKYVPYK